MTVARSFIHFHLNQMMHVSLRKEWILFILATSDATKPFQNMVTVNPNEAKVMPGEPDFVNPNSYHTIIKVLQNLGTRGGVVMYGGTDCKWLFVECDGLPYKIMRDIMDNTYICTKCNTSYYTAECSYIQLWGICKVCCWTMGTTYFQRYNYRGFIWPNYFPGISPKDVERGGRDGEINDETHLNEILNETSLPGNWMKFLKK